MKSNLVELLNV